jgi:3-dehydroquinate synthase
LLSAPLRLGDPDLADVVARCIRLKAEIVSQDERETSGLRAILNFGHTVGHALEAVTGYERYLHGQAIAIGMVVEARLVTNLGITDPTFAEVLANGLEQQGLPVDLPRDVDRAALVVAMRHDKKVRGSKFAFSLVETPGTCKLYADVPEAEVQRVLQT